MPAGFWLDLTSEDFRGRDMGRAIAVLPLAAVEQHGPHLPVGVDADLAQGYLDRAMPLVPADLDALVLPIQKIGISSEHIAFAGTLTLSPTTAIAAWTEIGASVHRAGGRKLVIVNAHGGNSAAADIVAQELRVRFGLLVVTTSWGRLGYPEGTFDAEELRHGIHAGEVETSLMLALDEGRVRVERAEDFVPATVGMAASFKRLSAGRPAGFAWMAQDLHPSGAMGWASRASAAKGEAALDHGARAFVELLREVDRFSLAGSSGA